MTFTQIQSRYVKVFRAVRKSVRASQTAGERLERELSRLINRQHGQLIQPNDLATAIRLFQLWDRQMQQVPKAFNDAQTVLNTQVAG